MKLNFLLFTGLLLVWCGCTPREGGDTAQIQFELSETHPYTATFHVKTPPGMEARMVRSVEKKGYRADTLSIFGGSSFSAGLYTIDAEWEFILQTRPASGGSWASYKSIRLHNKFPIEKFRRVNFKVAGDTVSTTIIDVLPYLQASWLLNNIVCGVFGPDWQPEAVIHTEDICAWHIRPNSGVESVFYHFIVSPPNNQTINFVIRSDASGVFLANPDGALCSILLTPLNQDSVRVWSIRDSNNNSLATLSGIEDEAMNRQITLTAPAGSQVQVSRCTGCIPE